MRHQAGKGQGLGTWLGYCSSDSAPGRRKVGANYNTVQIRTGACRRTCDGGGAAMPLHGFAFEAVPRPPHFADAPLLDALRVALPDQAFDAAIAASGAQEQRRCLLPARPRPPTPEHRDGRA